MIALKDSVRVFKGSSGDTMFVFEQDTHMNLVRDSLEEAARTAVIDGMNDDATVLFYIVRCIDEMYMNEAEKAEKIAKRIAEPVEEEKDYVFD